MTKHPGCLGHSHFTPAILTLIKEAPFTNKCPKIDNKLVTLIITIFH